MLTLKLHHGKQHQSFPVHRLQSCGSKTCAEMRNVLAGNSGGVLLDGRGRLIGINTAIASPSGASNGVGFAIPIDAVKGLVDQVGIPVAHRV